LERLNTLPAGEAELLLRQICASPAWAAAVVAGRPYPDAGAVRHAARDLWTGVGADEWRRAFAAHPRIGERGGASPEQSDREQAGLVAMDSATASAIVRGNQEYESRFGYVFLIRAAGRAPEEILQQLQDRLGHEPDDEIGIAAGQQAEITDRRLSAFLT
jgi:OHCU decarboxylase